MGFRQCASVPVDLLGPDRIAAASLNIVIGPVDGGDGASGATLTHELTELWRRRSCPPLHQTDMLWPPIRAIVPVSVAASLSDDVDALMNCEVTGVTSNKDAPGDANVTGPWRVGRRRPVRPRFRPVSMIDAACTNSVGFITRASASVVTPHELGR